MRPDAGWSLVPSCIVLVVGGISAVVLIWRRRPTATTIAVSLMMMLLISTLSFSFLPYLEAFKSQRRFALVIGKIAPASTPLYVYADTMNDFNYYSRRPRIAVLALPAPVAALRERGEKSYVLIQERHLKKLPAIPSEWIVASNSPDEATWHLVEFDRRWNRN